MSAGISRSLLSLIAMLMIVAASWVLILGETYVFFVVIRPLGPPLHEAGLPSSMVKIALTMGLGAFLILAMFGMSRIYLKAFTTPTPPS
jgi:hypothetical protein